MWTRFLCAAALVSAASGATVFAQAPPATPAGDGWVVLTVADYLALREKANPRAPRT